MLSATLGLIALLISGSVSANDVPIRQVPLNEGDSFSFTVVTITAAEGVSLCHLTTPSDGTFSFTPSDVSQSTTRYEVLSGDVMSGCRVMVHDFVPSDSGMWSLYFTPGGESAAQRFNVDVTPRESHTENPDENVKLLSTINHFTRQGSYIDISLSKQQFEEECTLTAPDGKTLEELVGVTDQKSSDFVSCRVTIGPMVQDLLGAWRLCGKSKVDDTQRCQPVNIAWNNNNANTNWDAIVHPSFPHVVHYGGAVNPGVRGTGDLLTCHVITPANENLVLTPEAQYPGLEQVTNNPALCSVVISISGERDLGHWTVYGMYRSSVSGLNEARLPMEFALYNPEEPYEQAYNVTMLQNVNRVINLGNTISMQVDGLTQVDDCQVTSPSGQIVSQKGYTEVSGVKYESIGGACRVTIGPITAEMTGVWQLIGKFNDGIQFSERVQPFLIIKEDPENPIQEEHRLIVNMDEEIMETSMGKTFRITIPTAAFTDGESCHLRTPDGRQYTIMEGFNIDGVNVIDESGVLCGVTVDLISEDLIGNWVLISRSMRLSQAIETRLPFTVSVEERVMAVPNHVNIAEGSNLYVRLEKPTDLFETCELNGPDGKSIEHELDAAFSTSCGYIIKSVAVGQSGTWEIVYGNKIVYRAVIDVNIFASSSISVERQTWTLGTPVLATIGPDDAVYCRLRDVQGATVFESFGPCILDVERVTEAHGGIWTMSVGMPGTVLLEDVPFIVTVVEADSSVMVTTSVVREAPSVLLSCSVPADLEVNGCKFRDHRGNTMIVHQGVGQDGSTGAVSTSFESQLEANTCTLRLRNPSVQDLGLWRCGVDTTGETLYAFLNVTCPWLLQQPGVAESVVLEPILTQERTSILSVEGDSTVLSCGIDASLRYCYFRARNGTVFNARPGVSSSSYEYVGAGLHAGECGIRFNGLLATDSGRWSCHVGLVDTTAEEQRVQIDVEIQERMRVSHLRSAHGGLVLEGAVHGNHRLEYCRFIRIDGLGFTSDNVPSGYSVDTSMMLNGYCVLVMEQPTMLNLHPWTVVAKLAGVDQEIAKSSNGDLVMGEIPVDQPGGRNVQLTLLWISCMLTLLAVVTLGVALVPKKNRKWTYERANDIRNSFKKTPLPPQNEAPNVQNA